MARPLRIDYAHAFYHVTCRGNEQQAIYQDNRDRSVFVEKLQLSLAIYSVRLHCYVLMSNHFHLIVETPKANLSEFMRHFNVSYTGYYNRRHRRVGHLYQGRFKSILVEADSYLLGLSRYVHLNPVRVGVLRRHGYKEKLRYLQRYGWSSLEGYVESGKRRAWVIYDGVLDYVGGSRKRYARYIEEGLQEGYGSPWEDLKGQVVLGEEGFWEKVRGKWKKGRESVKEQPSLRALQKVEGEEVLREAARQFKLKPEELRKKRTGYRDQRGLVMELMCRYSEMKQREVGEMMGGIDYTTVSHERKRIRERMGSDSRLREWSKDVESRLMPKTKI